MHDETRNFIGMRTKSFDRNGSDHGRLEEKVAIVTSEKTGDILDFGLADGSDTAGELPKSHWDRKKAQLDYERALYRFGIFR